MPQISSIRTESPYGAGVSPQIVRGQDVEHADHPAFLRNKPVPENLRALVPASSDMITRLATAGKNIAIDAANTTIQYTRRAAHHAQTIAQEFTHDTVTGARRELRSTTHRLPARAQALIALTGSSDAAATLSAQHHERVMGAKPTQEKTARPPTLESVPENVTINDISTVDRYRAKHATRIGMALNHADTPPSARQRLDAVMPTHRTALSFHQPTVHSPAPSNPRVVAHEPTRAAIPESIDGFVMVHAKDVGESPA